MPQPERDAGHLWDILAAARGVISELEKVDYAGYLANENLRLAIERRIEIIGEAARRVSEGFRAAHPDIPWRLMIDQRNVLIHMYDEIDHTRIWNLAKDHLPKLVADIESLLPPPPA